MKTVSIHKTSVRSHKNTGILLVSLDRYHVTNQMQVGHPLSKNINPKSKILEISILCMIYILYFNIFKLGMLNK